MRKTFAVFVMVVCLVVMSLGVSACNSGQTAQGISNALGGILNIAQAEETAVSSGDAAILAHWVSLGQTLQLQLNGCVQASGNGKTKLVACFNGFAGGLLSPAELTQLRLLSPGVRGKVQVIATAALIAVNGALTQFGANAQANPAIATAPAAAADLRQLEESLRNGGYLDDTGRNSSSGAGVPAARARTTEGARRVVSPDPQV